MPITDYLQSIVAIPDGILEYLDFSSVTLPFNMQAQTQSNWCWAATATSVSRFYRSWSSWTQCGVANGELGLTTCCNSPVPGACNVPWFLDRALTRTDNYVSIGGPLSFTDVEQELKAGRVVGARIGWSGGGGHFMVIYGAVRIGSRRYFQIDDPIFGKSQLTVANFSNNYQGSGSWTHAYRTKRAKLVFNIELIPIPDFLPKVLAKHLAVPGAGLAGVAPGTDLALGFAHRGYSLGLSDLAKRRLQLESPSFTRVIQLAGSRPVGYVDVDDGAGDEVAQVGGAESGYPQAFEQALDIAEKAEVLEGKTVEPRLLRIPALYTDVLWLHVEDGDDYAIVATSAQEVRRGEVVPLDSLLGELRDLAAAQLKLYGDDEEGLKGS